MDFYSLCAKYWGVDRVTAKTRVICLYMGAGAAFDSYYRSISEPQLAFQRVSSQQPLVLACIPTEARAELLEHYGIVLGDN